MKVLKPLIDNKFALPQTKQTIKYASGSIVQTNKRDEPISFMSIPDLAFKSKYLSGLNLSFKGEKEVKENYDYKKFAKYPPVNKNLPDVKFYVYPQDPLVTKTLQVCNLKCDVKPGPASDRVMVVDENSNLSLPNDDGNFIKDTSSTSFDRNNPFYFVSKTLELYERFLGRKIPWAFGDEPLKIFSNAGETPNAYYDRNKKAISLYRFQNAFKPDETCYTSRMADLMTHEAGHAVLDGLRPLYLGWGKSGRAIHEGFGDSTAIVVALWNDKLLDKMIKETAGNLRKDNVIALFAEQFGAAIKGEPGLRNALNYLKVSDFEGKEMTETKEVHNYGRLMAGMFYDIVVEIAEKHSKNMPLKEALIKTREDVTQLLIRTMADFAPYGFVNYDDIAKAFLIAENVDFKGQYHEELVKVFTDREILKPQDVKNWSEDLAKLPDFKLNPDSIKSKEALVNYINTHQNELNVPEDYIYKIADSYINDHGELFLFMKAPINYKPDDKEYVKPDDLDSIIYVNQTYHHLRVAFDKDGQLIHKTEHKKQEVDIIDDEDEMIEFRKQHPEMKK